MGIHLPESNFQPPYPPCPPCPQFTQYSFPDFASYTPFSGPPIEEKSELEKSIEAVAYAGFSFSEGGDIMNQN